MEIIKTTLVKLVASEGKSLIHINEYNNKEYDEEGNIIKPTGSKIVYLADGQNPNNFIEVDDEELIENDGN